MDENTTATMPTGEYEPLMPEGWADGDVLFDEDPDEPTEVEAESAPEESPAEDESANPASDEPPTTAESEEPGAEDTEDAPTTEPTEETAATPSRLRFQARIDHEDRDVELDEADLPTIYQKAQATDRAQQRMREMQDVTDQAAQIAKMLGYENPAEMFAAVTENHRNSEIERLVDEGTAQSVAEFIVDQRMQTARQTPAARTAPSAQAAESPSSSAGDSGAQAQAPVDSGPRDFGDEVRELLRARPQLVGKPLPDEVVNAATAGGRRLLDAYTDYESVGVRKEAERLRKENSVLKQNAEAAKRAPVKSSTAGGKTDTSPTDPFLKGFDADKW